MTFFLIHAHILSDATRQIHDIPDGILTGQVAHWKDMEKLINDYSANVRVPTRKWSDLYNNVIRSLAKLKGTNSNLKIDLLLGRYATKAESYIADRDVLYSFQEAFKSSLLAHDLQTSRDRAFAQGRITGNILLELGDQQLTSEVSSTIEGSNTNGEDLEADQEEDTAGIANGCCYLHHRRLLYMHHLILDVCL
ncbi:hypothetical protein MBANPS3_000856 [Mucor bainieri]